MMVDEKRNEEVKETTSEVGASDEKTSPVGEEAKEKENESEVEKLKEEVRKMKEEYQKKEKESKEYRELLIRLKAEFDNYRKRVSKEILESRKAGIADFVSDLLAVMDNFDRALNSFSNMENVSDELRSFIDGMRMVYEEMKNVFKKYGIVEYDPSGEEFDPSISEAIAVEDIEGDKDKVIEVFQKGYRMEDRIIRTAKVKVGKASKKPSEDDTNNDSNKDNNNSENK